jgi:hypothetical protein
MADCGLSTHKTGHSGKKLHLNLNIALPVAALLLSAVCVYWACEYFVNGVEWVGSKAGVSQNAVGTVLAAFGTALPESVVTFVAVLGHSAEAKNIGVGAALGGPLVLATIAYPVVGLMLLLTRTGGATLPIALNWRRLSRDQGWFLIIFTCKIALGFVAFAIKPWLGWLFLLAYGAYTWTEMRDAGDDIEGDLEPLKFQPKSGCIVGHFRRIPGVRRPIIGDRTLAGHSIGRRGADPKPGRNGAPRNHERHYLDSPR